MPVMAKPAIRPRRGVLVQVPNRWRKWWPAAFFRPLVIISMASMNNARPPRIWNTDEIMVRLSFQRIGWSVAELRKERPQAVLIGLAQYLLQGQFFDLGNLFCDERQVEGRVLPATVGYRRQEGGVGFQQNLLDGCHPYDVANVLGLVEAGDAIKAKTPALVQGIASQAGAGCETMNHAPPGQGLFEFLEDGDGVVVGVPAVNHHRLLAITGNLQLAAEYLPLHTPVGIVVVVVQADFTDGNDLFIPGMLADFSLYLIGIAFCFMRVNTLGAIHPGLNLTEFPNGRQVARGHGNGDDPLDVDLPALFQCFGQRPVFQVIQMAMGLDDRVIKYGNLTTFLAHAWGLCSITAVAWLLF